MKIIQVGPAPLTNQEVNSILQAEILDLRRRSKLLENPEEVREDKEGVRRALDSATQISQYLQRCCPAVRHSDKDSVSRFLASIADLPFHDDEILSIVNLGPDEPVFFYGMCDDCQERFSEDDLNRTCDLVRRHLLGGKSATGEADPIADVSEREVAHTGEVAPLKHETAKENLECKGTASAASPTSDVPEKEVLKSEGTDPEATKSQHGMEGSTVTKVPDNAAVEKPLLQEPKAEAPASRGAKRRKKGRIVEDD